MDKDTKHQHQTGTVGHPPYGMQVPHKGIVGQAISAMANLSVSTWPQPWPDATGTVIGKSSYGKEGAKEDAMRLRKAMKGSDKGTIVEIAGNRTFDQRRMIVTEYIHIDGKEERNLIYDLKNELGSDLEKLVVPLFLMPGAFDVCLLEKAMRGVGTDQDLLNEILCTRNNKEIDQMKMAWKEKMSKEGNLVEWVGDETKKIFGMNMYHRLCLKLLEGKRPVSTKPDEKKVRADAEELNNLLSRSGGFRSEHPSSERYSSERHTSEHTTSEHTSGHSEQSSDVKCKFIEIFTERSWPHIGALVAEFQSVSQDFTLDGAISREFGDSSDTTKALRVITEFCSQPYDFWAKKLRDAMKGIGTDDSKLIRIIVSRCETDLLNIAQIFGQRYGDDKTLKSWIEQETSSFYRQLLLFLCGYGTCHH